MSDPRAVRRILLIRRKALGDALVALPAVIAVAEAWPKAEIDLVIDRPFAGLLAELAGNVRVLRYPEVDGGPWIATLRRRRYDLVIDWLGSPRTALWTALSGAPLRVGYDLPRRRWAYNVRVPRHKLGEHRLRGFAGEAFLDPLRALGLAPAPWCADVLAGASSREPRPAPASVFGRWLAERGRSGKPDVVLVMSATWSAKEWPARHVAGLWLLLEESGVRAVLAPGPGDAALLAALQPLLPPHSLAPPSTLAEMGELLRASDLFIGTDNGVRHLAAQLGLPTVTVFGPTDPAGWNPPGARHVAISTDVSCSPCDLLECPVVGHPCLSELKPETVAVAALKLLGLQPPAASISSVKGE